MAGARVTQVVAEALRDGAPAARATQVAAEVLRDGSPAARVTQAVAEVLRSSADFVSPPSAQPGLSPTFGPPIPGAPWAALRRPPGPRVSPSPEALLADVMMPPDRPAAPVTHGPPIPGAPWTALFRVEPPRPLGNNRAPAAPTPTGPGRGKARPYLGRVPRSFKQANESAEQTAAREDQERRRLARLTEELHYRINALVSTGELQQMGTADWRLRSGGHAFDRDPTADDDRNAGCTVGSTWVNTTTLAVFVCQRNAAGNAAWKEIP